PIALNPIRLIRNRVTLIGDNRPKELLPLGIRKLRLVEQLQLPTEIGNQIFLTPHRDMLISLSLQLSDQHPLQLSLRLISLSCVLVWLVDRHHRTTSAVVRVSSNQ